jgi:hypothetical protein
MKGDPRYTSNTVFDSFPWPQNPSAKQVKNIAKYAADLRQERKRVMDDQRLGLRDLYRLIEETPENTVSDIQDKLDAAVMAAYGMKKSADIPAFLLSLNNELFEKEKAGQSIVGPGLPGFVTNPEEYITDDCIKMPVVHVQRH